MKAKQEAERIVNLFKSNRFYHVQTKTLALICVDQKKLSALKQLESVSEHLPYDVYTKAVIGISYRYKTLEKLIKQM